MRQHIHLGRGRSIHRHHIAHALHTHHLTGHHIHHTGHGHIHHKAGMGTPAVKKDGGRMVAHMNAYSTEPRKHGAGRKPLKFRL